MTTTVAEAWDGTRWRIRRTPNPTGSTYSALDGVSCTSPTACTAVGISLNGSGQTSLAEVWDGTKWRIQHTPNPAGSTHSGLQAVSCTSLTACTAVGQTYLPGGTDSAPLAEAWNGTKWVLQNPPTPAGASFPTLLGVSCTSATACTAVGHYHDGSPSGTNLTLAEAWNGTAWTIQPTPSSGHVLFAVSCTSSTACIAVGDPVSPALTTPLAESWDGASWTVTSTLSPVGATNPTLFGVSCTSATACTAVGSYNLSTGHLHALVERYS